MLRSKMTIASALCVVAASLISYGSEAAVLSNARAEFSGVTCRQTSGGIYSIFAGTIFNNSSTTDMSVICPLSMPPTTNNTALSTSFVTIFDRNPSAEVSCTLVGEVIDGVGITQQFSTAKTSAADNSPNAFFKFFAPVSGFDFYATCSVPRSTASGVSHIGTFDIEKN